MRPESAPADRQMVHQCLGKDRPGGVARAQEEDVERHSFLAFYHRSESHGRKVVDLCGATSAAETLNFTYQGSRDWLVKFDVSPTEPAGFAGWLVASVSSVVKAFSGSCVRARVDTSA
jgi:hypothetical protein